jgi:hypothetical protein
MSDPNSVRRSSAFRKFPVERRAWIRFGADLDAACHAKGALKDVGWTAKVKDISRGGVGLLLRHRFRAGTPLVLELKSRDGSFCRTMTAQVARVMAVLAEGRPNWFLGCAFDQPLSEEELQKLL